MATQAIAGYTGLVYVSNDGGSTYVQIGELTDVELEISTEMLDATSHSSAGSKEVIPGLQSWKATAKQLYIASDVAQGNILAGVTAKSKLKFRFDPGGTTTGKDRFSGDGYVDDWKLSEDTTAVAMEDLSITGTGALTKSTQ